MRFVRKNPIPAKYAFDEYALKLVDNFLDVGVLLDSKFNFIPHIFMTVNGSSLDCRRTRVRSMSAY